MSSMIVRSGTREASISAVVTHPDGTTVDHGVVAYWNRNPVKRLAWWLGRLCRRLAR